MTPVETVTANLPLIVGIVVFVVFTIGLVLALRTEGGRESLAAGAVRLALAMLALAERWLGHQMEPVTLQGATGPRTVYKQTPITLARVELTAWLARR